MFEGDEPRRQTEEICRAALRLEHDVLIRDNPVGRCRYMTLSFDHNCRQGLHGLGGMRFTLNRENQAQDDQ